MVELNPQQKWSEVHKNIVSHFSLLIFHQFRALFSIIAFHSFAAIPRLQCNPAD